MLPFGVQTQDEDGDVDARHRRSAPRGRILLRAALAHDDRLAAIIFGGVLAAVERFGCRIDDIAHRADF